MKKIYLLFLILSTSILDVSMSYANTQVPAKDVTVNTSTFNHNLGPSDNTVQAALNTLDQVTGGGGTPGGVNTQYQINNNGVFAGGNMYQVGNNVGVGSTSPVALLDVSGNVRVQGLTLPVGTALAGKILTSDANGNASWQNNAASGGGVNPGIQGDFPYYASNGNVVSDQNVLTINGGNVGIGAPSPSFNLQVNGSVGATSFSGLGVISGLTTGYIPQASGAASLTNSIIQQVNGNIGVGSTNPGKNLDVQGTVRSTFSIIGTLNGILKGTSGAVGTATSGTDYAPATSGTSILKGNGSGGFSNAVGGTDYQTPLTFSTGLTNTAGNVVVNNSQNIVQLSNLTTNGLVTTSGGVGNLSITPFGGNLGLWETNSIGIDTFSPAVGIGSTVPGARLDVAGTVKAQGFTSSSAGAMLVASNQGIGIDSSHSPYTSPAIYLTTTGNTGIGTTNVPSGDQAYVAGQLEVQGIKLSASPSSGYILTSNSVGVGTWQPAPASTPPGGSATQLQYNAGGSFGGVTGSGVVGGNVGIGSVNPEYGLVAYNGAKINGNGPSSFGSNVGIGSVNPGQALDIVGTARMTGFTMNTGSSLNGKVMTSDANGNGSWTSVGGSGTVTTVSVVTANGISGSVANPTTTPAITLTPFLNWSGINWTDTNLHAGINSSGVNWNDINKNSTINSGGINWPGIGNYSSGFMKWNGSNPPSQDTNTYLTGNQTITLSGAVTGSGATSIATTLANLIVQTGNVNWPSVNGLPTINSGGINWANINGLNPINSGGVNWNNITSYATGAQLTATTAGGVNWNNNLLFNGTTSYFNQGNVAVGSTSPTSVFQVVGNTGIGTTGTMTTPNQLIVNNNIYFNSEYSYSSNIGIGTTTINWNNGSDQNIGIGTSQGDYIAFTHPSNSNAAKLQLRILEDSTGSRVVQFWPSTVKWSAGTAPTLSGANKSDFVNCFWNGTTDYCQSATNF